MSLHRLKRLATLIVRMPEQILRHFFEQGMAQGGKSTALKPLGWLLSILIVGLLAAGRVGLDKWIITIFVIFMNMILVFCPWGTKATA